MHLNQGATVAFRHFLIDAKPFPFTLEIRHLTTAANI